jgi:hypothetical protein
MGAFLRNLGLLASGVWAAMLLLGEKIDHPIFDHKSSVLAAGVLMLVAGIVLGFLDRARGAVVRRHCARCHRTVARGEVYCTEHFRETVNQARDAQQL